MFKQADSFCLKWLLLRRYFWSIRFLDSRRLQNLGKVGYYIILDSPRLTISCLQNIPQNIKFWWSAKNPSWNRVYTRIKRNILWKLLTIFRKFSSKNFLTTVRKFFSKSSFRGLFFKRFFRRFFHWKTSCTFGKFF